MTAASSPVGKLQWAKPIPSLQPGSSNRFSRATSLTWWSWPKENLGLELRRGFRGQGGMAQPVHAAKFCGMGQGICMYTGVVISAHPSKAQDLLASLPCCCRQDLRGDWWYSYDCQFRLPSQTSVKPNVVMLAASAIFFVIMFRESRFYFLRCQK